ncbi:MAG: DUF177 domain-containing protein [Thermoleophilaceae bacterium]|nr:DUF177 domain-containing protein [Thermoleophilaceae bacterium]
MGQRSDVLDLARLSLRSGEGRRIGTAVRVDPLELGGQRYTAEGGEAQVVLDVSRTTAGYALRLRSRIRLEGPCVRCLEPASPVAELDAREVDQPGGDEELRSPYIRGDELDLRAWTRDALIFELPAQIVCREDCLGLCAVCGENLNLAEPGHRHEAAPDPRWAKLSELRFDD